MYTICKHIYMSIVHSMRIEEKDKEFLNSNEGRELLDIIFNIVEPSVFLDALHMLSGKNASIPMLALTLENLVKQGVIRTQSLYETDGMRELAKRKGLDTQTMLNFLVSETLKKSEEDEELPIEYIE